MDMWHAHPAFPALMLFRTPLAPLILGPLLQLGGPLLAEAAMGIAYAVSVVAFATAAAAFGRRVAVATAAALLAFPAYGALFHQISSDPVFALVYALWTLALVRAFNLPTVWRFAVLGVLLVALVLARPGSEILLVFAVAPLLIVRAGWRNRLVWAGTFLGVSVGLLALWAGYNDARYGSFVVAREGWANVPFYRVFYMDKLVRPGNGPASRNLANVIQRDVLSKPPYSTDGLNTTDKFFTLATEHMWEDTVVAVDRAYGWHSDYAVLRTVSIEAIRRHFRLYVRDVAGAVWDEMRYPYKWPAVGKRRPPSALPAARVLASHPVTVLNTPGRTWWLASTPTGAPPVPARVRRMTREVARLQRAVPERSGSPSVARVLNGISGVYPWASLWMAGALVLIAVRRPLRAPALFVMIALAMLVIVETELGEPPVLEYGLPFEPVFILCLAAGALGSRRYFEPSRVTT
ncbi:MAG: hypothetical protein ACRDL2_01085 [Gaiellaceae bacterium]